MTHNEAFKLCFGNKIPMPYLNFRKTFQRNQVVLRLVFASAILHSGLTFYPWLNFFFPYFFTEILYQYQIHTAKPIVILTICFAICLG